MHWDISEKERTSDTIKVQCYISEQNNGIMIIYYALQKLNTCMDL